ncbi:MAG: thioesterase family protein [Cyanobacteria bacterium P01_D01_bin.1]
MAFRYCRTIRFQETDAAGVAYFANVLTYCHEAYEAALQETPIDVKRFFSALNEYPVPVVHAQADYFAPMFVGDAIAITLIPKPLTLYSYEIRYALHYQQPRPPVEHSLVAPSSVAPSSAAQSESGPLATALTRHVCISKATRRKQPIDNYLTDWIVDLAASAASDD